MLRVETVTRRFGGLTAVDSVSLDVAAGTVHALIGPNGAGKTTLFSIVSGLVSADSGRIILADRDITRLEPFRRTAMGIGRTFQNIRIFGEMSVLENVATGLHPRLGASWPATILRLPAARREERETLARARDLLGFVGLAGAADTAAADLPYGDQRRLEIARALASDPKLLLLDEPAAGMNPAETAALVALLRELKQTGLTTLLVEHDMSFVMGLSDEVTVLNFGRRVASGTPAQVRADPAVIEAYLGRSEAAAEPRTLAGQA